jgi:MFS superfamily sulfate permease-like transporter
MKTIIGLFFGKDKDKRYKSENLQFDFFAAITLSAVVLPLAMAYARIAGLNSINGLYGKIK